MKDAFDNEATGTITVTVTRPLAPPTSVWTAADAPVDVEVLEMAFDPDGDELTTTAVTQGADGSVTIETDGSITYTPDKSFTGEDSFTYTVEDPDGNEATNTITVTVGPTDPIALDWGVETAVDTSVNVEVLDLAYQPAGGSLTTISVTQGDHGTVAIELDGSVTYLPDTSYTGEDTFTYTVEDANSNTATGTISVQVGPAAATTGDEIISDLEGIEDEFTNYTSGSAATIATAVSSIVPTITGYLAALTSYVSSNNIDTLGANKPLSEFQPAVWTSLMKGLYPDYMTARETEALLWNIALASKSRIAALKAELDATNNAVAGAALVYAIETLTSAHKGLENTWKAVYGLTRSKFYPAAAAMWAGLNVNLPPALQNALAPPSPPFRFAPDITP